jgi:hypothetical protein
MLAKFRDAADDDARRCAAVLIGSLSRWQARRKFSRIDPYPEAEEALAALVSNIIA